MTQDLFLPFYPFFASGNQSRGKNCFYNYVPFSDILNIFGRCEEVFASVVMVELLSSCSFLKHRVNTKKWINGFIYLQQKSNLHVLRITLIQPSMHACVLRHFSSVWLFATLWTAAYHVLLPIGFSGQEYWSGLPCPPPGDLPDPGIEPASVTSPAFAGGFFTTNATWEALIPLYLQSNN